MRRGTIVGFEKIPIEQRNAYEKRNNLVKKFLNVVGA